MKLGIDVGGSNTKLAIIQNQKIIKHWTIKTDFKNCQTWIKKVLASCKQVYQEYPFEKVAISSAGIIDSNGLVINANNSAKNYIGTNWKKLFNNYFQKPIFTFACNDAHALAYYVLKKDSNNALCLTLGTGLGLSLILNNKVYTGERLLAGQIGSIFLTPTKNLDQIFSATSLKAQIEKLCQAKITFQELHHYYKSNLAIKKLVNQYLNDLAKLIAYTSSLLELETIYIGGGLSYAGPFLLKILHTYLKKLMPDIWIDLPVIKYPKAKNDANILGLF